MGRTRKAWTDREMRFLRDNYKEKTNKQLAVELNKTLSSVKFMRYKFALNKETAGETVKHARDIIAQGHPCERCQKKQCPVSCRAWNLYFKANWNKIRHAAGKEELKEYIR